jgi:hypothetical protein
MKSIRERLDQAITEHHRVREEIDALERQHPLEALREALRRQVRRFRQTRA